MGKCEITTNACNAMHSNLIGNHIATGACANELSITPSSLIQLASLIGIGKIPCSGRCTRYSAHLNTLELSSIP